VVKGTRVPELTTAQRNSISQNNIANAKGQAIYNLDTNCFEYWNGSKWVSLCLGTANITLTGNPCNYNPTALAPADGVQADCEFTPADDPACVLQGQQAYQVYLTAGSSYTTLSVDELTSAFSLKFQPNISANNRIAVVRVVNNCSGEFQDFLFTQEGATCPTGANAFTVKAATQNLCGDNGAVIAYVENPQSGIDYLWEYGGVVLNTGNYMEITRAGKYTVYAGLMGCSTPTPQEITITKSAGNSASAPVVTVSNSGILCSGGNVILTASNISDPQVKWFHNGVYSGQSVNPLTLSGAAAAGEWFAIQHSNGGCGSYASNIVVLADQTANGTALAAPVATVNGTSLSGSPTVCKGGTLELAVTNATAYPAGTVYQWFDNGVKIAESTNAIIYAVASGKSAMVLSVQVSNNSGACPNTATSSAIAVNFTASAPTTINNGASTEAICGSTPATLMATNSAGVEYEWFRNGTPIPSANTSSYSTTQQGDYSVRYQDANNCWSLVSNRIEVLQSAAISLSWQSEPKATAVIGNQESFTVLASPAPDNYTWTSSDLAVATVTAIDGGKSVSVNYLADGKFTLRVEARNSCGMVFLEKEIEVKPGCTPITSVNLTPSGTVSKNLDAAGKAKTSGDGKTDFTATATNGSPATSYEWFVNGAIQAETTSTFSYTTPTTAGSYTVTARAYNACTGMPGNSNGALSAATTVTVNKDATADVSGNYRLSGKTCFDVKRGNDNNSCMPLASRTDNFASTKSFTYTFSSPNGSTYSNLSFSLTDNNALVASSTTASNVLTVTFRSDINDVASGTDKTTAKKLSIVARYKDNSGAEKQITLDVSVQDCSCGCSVKSTLPAGWLTFMCYNLGVPESSKNLTLNEQMAYTSPTGTDVTNNVVYGDLYQWGRQADGHQIRSNTSVSGPYTGPYDSNGQVPSTASAYGHFITNTNSRADWRNQLNTLWDASKTGSDPCPAGWRVPTRAEWASIMSGSVTTNLTVTNGKVTGSSGNTWTWKSSTGTHGYAISPDGGATTTLFLPAAGNRYAGTTAGYIDKVGSVGYYWTATPDNTASYPMSFSGTIVTISGSLNRAYGFSVRCVAE
jgi:uncharacterized protein (TIGR02145 family)